jgi:hypothetical protein
VVAENGVEVKDCMWTQAQIAAFMKFQAKQRGIFKGHDGGGTRSDRFVDVESGGGGGERSQGASTGRGGGAQGAAAGEDPTEGEDVFETRCKERMRSIAKCALMTAQGQVEHRKNSWELYGYVPGGGGGRVETLSSASFRKWLEGAPFNLL